MYEVLLDRNRWYIIKIKPDGKNYDVVLQLFNLLENPKEVAIKLTEALNASEKALSLNLEK